MRMNRLIYAGAIIGSITFATFYGGNIAYALLYLTILIPVVAYIYTIYVYFQFKLYQSMESNQVVKGDWTGYSFVIANEDFITFRNVKVNFLSDKSTLEAANQKMEYSLLPSEKERVETKIKCNFRGEYEVGVESIEVTDFLYLFSITYPISTKLKVTVLPRIVPLEQLRIAPPEIDVKNPQRFSNSVEEELDSEIRKYCPGDSRKRIHWKATAKLHELISRKYQNVPKTEIVLFMDLTEVSEEEIKVVMTEDKIIELILAIVNFYTQRGITSQIIYELDGKMLVPIHTKDNFNAFYKACASITFHGKTLVSDLILERMLRVEWGMFYIVVTHYLSKELYLASLQVIANGNWMAILLVSDDVSEETKQLMKNMKQSQIMVYQVMSKEEIADIIS
jgi:hypothetical protein